MLFHKMNILNTIMDCIYINFNDITHLLVMCCCETLCLVGFLSPSTTWCFETRLDKMHCTKWQLYKRDTTYWNCIQYGFRTTSLNSWKLFTEVKHHVTLYKPSSFSNLNFLAIRKKNAGVRKVLLSIISFYRLLGDKQKHNYETFYCDFIFLWSFLYR